MFLIFVKRLEFLLMALNKLCIIIIITMGTGMGTDPGYQVADERLWV